MKKKNCRISNSKLEELFTLGDLCVSDFLKKEDEEPEKFELKLMLSKESGLVQLETGVDPDKMYERYQHYNITFHEDDGPITTLLLQCDLLSVLILHAHKVVLVPALSLEPLVLPPWIFLRPRLPLLPCKMQQ